MSSFSMYDKFLFYKPILFHKFIYRSQIAALATLVVALGIDSASSFLGSAKVVPIEIAATITAAESNTTASQRSANPFVPTVEPPRKTLEIKSPAEIEVAAATQARRTRDCTHRFFWCSRNSDSRPAQPLQSQHRTNTRRTASSVDCQPRQAEALLLSSHAAWFE